MKELLQQINTDALPQHVAIIMDGNGRWAKQRGQARVFGHNAGVKSVRTVTKTAGDLGVKYLTLYTFSTENWNRPTLEVTALMKLLVDTITKEIDQLHKNDVRVMTIGDLSAMPPRTRDAMQKGVDKTSNNKGLTLILALNYSGRWELTRAARQMANDAVNGQIDPEAINDALFERYLSTRDIPDPELLIRTSGEHRLSNFLLWQLAYAEFCFLPVLWPDFQEAHFYQAIIDFQQRERRFGKTGDQIKP